MKVYLDNAATIPLKENVKKYLINILDLYGNPSSLHSTGEIAKQIIEKSRKTIANFINANEQEIYFTGGGSASNTLGIKGFVQKNSNYQVYYSPTVHKSILKLLESKSLSNPIYPLTVDSCGIIILKELESSIAGRKPFVIIEYANSEIGTIQDIKEIIDIVHFYKGVVYLDCTGSISTIPLDVKKLDVDMCGFSAHKLGGLKGCGVLYKRNDILLEPLVYGSQENGLIGGTENVLGIASLNKAIEDYDYSSISPGNRNYVYNYIIKNIPNSYLIGASIDSGKRLPHNLYMCFKGIEGESLMFLMDINGIQVSTGSACSSGNLSPSTTLSAIGMNEQDIYSCIRMTFSGCETKNEINYICKTLKICVEHLRKFNN